MVFTHKYRVPLWTDRASLALAQLCLHDIVLFEVIGVIKSVLLMLLMHSQELEAVCRLVRV